MTIHSVFSLQPFNMRQQQSVPTGCRLTFATSYHLMLHLSQPTQPKYIVLTSIPSRDAHFTFYAFPPLPVTTPLTQRNPWTGLSLKIILTVLPPSTGRHNDNRRCRASLFAAPLVPVDVNLEEDHGQDLVAQVAGPKRQEHQANCRT